MRDCFENRASKQLRSRTGLMSSRARLALYLVIAKELVPEETVSLAVEEVTR
jgi:hypothetical protein